MKKKARMKLDIETARDLAVACGDIAIAIDVASSSSFPNVALAELEPALRELRAGLDAVLSPRLYHDYSGR